MRTDDAKVCEGIMRDFPKMRATLRMLERMAAGPSLPGCERVDGGESVPAAQRLLEDKKIAELNEIVRSVERAVRDLPGYMQKPVILVYFLGRRFDLAAAELNCDHNTVRRQCKRALDMMRRTLIGLYYRVLDWREEWEREIEEEFDSSAGSAK
jgi:DNA-directed RNA polymerase specialized sigma24 family protein